MLELVNVTHAFDGKPLLKGISFFVGEEEVLCLLGSSGSGKSTILKIIAGLESPISGDILYNGKSILDVPVHKRNFGMVFQDYALFPHMTVFENIAFGLKMQHLNSSELSGKVRNALRQIGMESFADRKVTELSGGEQQRVALARSLVVHPALLMLDEPLGALDYSLRQNLIEELKSILGKNGIPAIYVTHDQNEAMSLSDRIAILHDGKIIQTDSPEDLYNHPATLWCANFLGFHNFIPCTVSENSEIIVNNFGEKKTLKIDCLSKKPGEPASVLLKDGMIIDEAEHCGNMLLLNAVPINNIYRGNYYNTTLKIDDAAEISIHSKNKLPVNEILQIAFSENGIIVY